MVFYDFMHEGWRNTEDESFFIDMSMEGPYKEYLQEFATVEEFMRWYEGGTEKGVFSNDNYL